MTANLGVVPIYVTVFNRFTWLRQMTSQLAKLPNVELILVDNASTYPPLVNWLDVCPYTVVYLPSNLGHRSPWLSQAVLAADEHRRTYGSDHYVVTDPDLDFSGVPLDLIDRCIDGLTRHPGVVQCGPALRIDDLPSIEESAVNMAQIRSVESRYWGEPLGDDFYVAPIDTTFAVYSVDTPHAVAMSPANGVRLAGPYTARHLGWYLRKDEPLSEELKYYFAHADASASSRP